MAENAETFHTAQMRSMTAMATFIQHSSLSTQMTAMANIFGEDFTAQVRAAAGGPGTEQERNTRIMRAFFQSLQGVIDPETLAEQMRQIEAGEAAAEPEGLRPVAARQAGAVATHGAGIRGEVREFLARPQVINRQNTTVRGQGGR
jgi:plasmid stability protein